MNKKTCIFVALVLILSSMLTACGSKETPEQAVTSALNAVKNSDVDTAQKYFDQDNLFVVDPETGKAVTDEENARLVLSKLNFKVLSSSIDGDTAVVKTEISNIDISSIAMEYFQQVMQLSADDNFDENANDEEIEAQLKKMLTDLLSRDDDTMTTSAIDITLSRHEDSWKINVTDDLKDAVLGGAISVAEVMGNISGSGESSEAN